MRCSGCHFFEESEEKTLIENLPAEDTQYRYKAGAVSRQCEKWRHVEQTARNCKDTIQSSAALIKCY
jgi:hypothetical protein